MRWGKHLTVARNDEKMTALLDEFGPEGYGVYWLMWEIVAEKSDGTCAKVTHPWKFFIKNLGVSGKKLSKFVEFFKKIGLFLIEKSENMLTVECPNILKYRDEYSSRTKKTPDKLPIVSGECQSQDTDTDTDTDTDRREEYKNPPTPLLEKYESTSKIHPCPCDEIIDLYHEELPELPKVRTREKLKITLRRMWDEDKERQNISWWIDFFRNDIKKSDFLMGRTQKSFAGCNLGWIIGPENRAKILNGQYRNRGPTLLSDSGYQTKTNVEAWAAKKFSTGGMK